MGLRGPQAKPTRLKILAGNPGKRALNMDEPTPLPGEVFQPADIAADPVALEEWARIVPMLRECGIIGRQDYLILADICRVHSRRVMAQAKVVELGPMVNGRFEPQMNPFIRLAQECERDLRLLYRSVGLDPAGRSALKVSTPKEQSKFSKFAEAVGE